MPTEKPKLQEPPRDFESLRSFIIEKREAMPKRLTQVGAYALQNPDEVAFGTAASIASAADVQPSTLVRFAHHLGYEGFSDLQTVFRERLRGRTSSYEERLRAIESEQHDESDETVLLHGFMTAAAKSVQMLAEGIDTAAFQRAVALLAKADTIFLVAKRRSYPLIAHMAYAFGKLKIRIHVVGSPNGIDNELVEMAGPNDAAIAVSFSPYATESVSHAQTMIANGVPLIAITDSAFSPLVTGAAEWLEVAEADYSGFRSLSASIALTMAIPVAVAEQRRKITSNGHRKRV